MIVVAEADGPVRFAFLDPRNTADGCVYGINPWRG